MWASQSATRADDTSAPIPNAQWAGSVRTSPNAGDPAPDMTMWIEVPSKQPIILDAYAAPGDVWKISTTRDYYPNHPDGVNVTFVDGHGEFRASEYISVKYRNM